MNEKLKEYEKELENCSNEYNSILEQINELEKKPIFEKYRKLKFDLSILGERYERLRKEYLKIMQLNCEHPLWYFLSDETDSYEQRQLWRCQCVKCGVKKEEHSREFKDKLIIESGNMGFGKVCNSPYKEVRNEYLKLEEDNNGKDEIIKMMIKKYNNQGK